MKQLKLLLTTLFIFIATPWISIGSKHLFLLDFYNQRFEFLFFSIEANTYQLIIATVILFCVISVLFAISMSRQWCGKFCPSTFMSGLYAMLVSSKGSFVKQLLFYILTLLIGTVFAVSLIGYFAPILELLSQIINNPNSFSAYIVLAIILLFCAQSILVRGWYCAYLCPYGALCAILPNQNRLFTTFSEEEAKCKNCLACIKICPVPKLDIRNGFDVRCIECGLCEIACDKIFTKEKSSGIIKSVDKNYIFAFNQKPAKTTIFTVIILAFTIITLYLLFNYNMLDYCELGNEFLH